MKKVLWIAAAAIVGAYFLVPGFGQGLMLWLSALLPKSITNRPGGTRVVGGELPSPVPSAPATMLTSPTPVVSNAPITGGGGSGAPEVVPSKPPVLGLDIMSTTNATTGSTISVSPYNPVASHDTGIVIAPYRPVGNGATAVPMPLVTPPPVLAAAAAPPAPAPKPTAPLPMDTPPPVVKITPSWNVTAPTNRYTTPTIRTDVLGPSPISSSIIKPAKGGGGLRF